LSAAKPGSGNEAKPSFPDFALLNPGYAQSLIVMGSRTHRRRHLTKIGF